MEYLIELNKTFLLTLSSITNEGRMTLKSHCFAKIRTVFKSTGREGFCINTNILWQRLRALREDVSRNKVTSAEQTVNSSVCRPLARVKASSRRLRAVSNVFCVNASISDISMQLQLKFVLEKSVIYVVFLYDTIWHHFRIWHAI